jgi:hypothetical protein
MLRFSTRRRWAAAVIASAVLFFLFVRPLCPYQSVPGTVDLRVTGISYPRDGVMRVSVVLANSTPLTLNVLDDADGNPQHPPYR